MIRFMISGAIWTLKELDQPKVDGKEVDGYADPDTNTLAVKKDLPVLRKIYIILHEFGHGVGFELGIDDEEPPSWIEHMLVIGIAKNLVANRKVIGKMLLNEKI